MAFIGSTKPNIAFINYATQSIVSYWIKKYSSTYVDDIKRYGIKNSSSYFILVSTKNSAAPLIFLSLGIYFSNCYIFSLHSCLSSLVFYLFSRHTHAKHSKLLHIDNSQMEEEKQQNKKCGACTKLNSWNGRKIEKRKLSKELEWKKQRENEIDIENKI